MHAMRDHVNAITDRVHMSHGHMKSMFDGVHAIREHKQATADRIHVSHGHMNPI